MTSRRKAVEEYVLKYVGEIVGKRNQDLYRDFFKSMNDSEFNKFMEDLRDGKINLSVIVDVNEEKNVTLDNNVKVGKKLGVQFFQRLNWTKDEINGIPAYKTKNEYLVLKLPVKRTSQLITKKISVAEDNKSRDTLTGQIISKSKAGRLTFPEIQVLIGYGLDNSIKELIKTRGGDLGESRALEMMLARRGDVSLKELEQFSTRVESSETLKRFLEAMHIRSTL